MDRTYVTQQAKTPVFQLGLDLWRDVVVRHRAIRERLLGTLLDLVRRERAGEVIDRALFKSTTQVRLFVSLSAHLACCL
jgi:cullin 3